MASMMINKDVRVHMACILINKDVRVHMGAYGSTDVRVHMACMSINKEVHMACRLINNDVRVDKACILINNDVRVHILEHWPRYRRTWRGYTCQNTGQDVDAHQILTTQGMVQKCDCKVSEQTFYRCKLNPDMQVQATICLLCSP